MSSKVSIEYRVKPVTRYIVTRFENSGELKGSVYERGEFENADTAYAVGYALCKADHDRLGYEVGSELIKYPTHPNQFALDSQQVVSKNRV